MYPKPLETSFESTVGHLVSIWLWLAKAQETTTWTFHKGAVTFQAHVDSIPFKGAAKHKGLVVTSIDIVNTRTKKITQTISPKRYLHASYLDSSTLVRLEDINFDGHVDLGVLSWTSTSIQKTYDFWVYEAEKQRFKRDSTLDTMWNPIFYAEHKVVYSHWRVGVNEIGHGIFRYERNSPICLVKRVEQWRMDQNLPGTLETTVLRNGQSIKTEFDIQDQGIES